MENFCTREEADYLIKKSREYPSKNKTLANTHAVNDVGNTFFSTNVFDRLHQDSRVLPIIARGAMLAGVPVDHVEAAIVSQLRDGTLYHGYHDFAEDLPTADCLCTMLIYLNDLKPEQGGATYFKDLNTAVQPMTGRAVIWSNMNPDGTMHMKIKPGTLPPRGEASEKWVMQLWISTPDLYARSHISFLPSLLEVFSAVYPESLCTGIPLVTTDLRFSRDVCKDAAVYFEPTNAKSAAAKIIMLAENEKEWHAKSARGREIFSLLPDAARKWELQRAMLEDIASRHYLKR